MPTYALPDQKIQPGDVGVKYHLGIGIPDPAGSGDTIIYGYCMVPSSNGFEEGIDVTARDQLLTASPNIIDRDLVRFPRQTQGVFSGGQGQVVFIDPTRYFDSDLDIRIPGHLRLQPKWKRIGAISGVVQISIIQAGGASVLVSFGEANMKWYYVGGADAFVTLTAPVAVLHLDADSRYAYLSDGNVVHRYSFWDAVPAYTAITSSIHGVLYDMWAVQLGTNGWYLFYKSDDGNLYRIDLTQAYPIAAAAQIQIPFGGNPVLIQDLVPYGTGVAIVTNDQTGNGFDVWYYDGGTNTTHMLRVNSAVAAGMCICLGDLYVGAYSANFRTGPWLYRISGGQASVIAQPTDPLAQTGSPSNLGCLPPEAGHDRVYWPVLNPSITGISGAVKGYILLYDVAAGGILSRLPNLDAGDFSWAVLNLTEPPSAAYPIGKQITAYGDNVAFGDVQAGSGYVQIQAPVLSVDSWAYQTTGWMVGSRIDFNTPGITKLMRRVILYHPPLTAGQAIYAEVHVDQDPLTFTTSLGPNPAGASVTNSTVGSTSTVLSIPQGTIGYTMYVAFRLHSGTSDATTPQLDHYTIEISTPFVFTATLDCTSKRLNLTRQKDATDQGLRGKDLYWLLKTAHQDAATVTLYHPDGNTYTCQVEDFKAQIKDPHLNTASTEYDPKDFDSYVTITLLQVAS